MKNIKAKFKILIAAGAALLVCVALLSCGGEENNKERIEGITREYKRGPLKVTQTLDRKQLTVAQSMLMTLKAEAPEEWQVSFPELKEKTGEFTVRKSTREEPVLSEDGKNAITKFIVVLDPFLAGNYKLPSLTVTFSNPDGKKHEIATEEIEIPVSSVIPVTDRKPSLRDITAVEKIPEDFTLWYIATAIVIAGAAAYAGYKLRHKETVALERILQPHEIALRDLERLTTSGLLKHHKVKEFYLGMSNILRVYIERRFHLAAPERTTEEFLEDLRRENKFADDHKTLLKNFLGHCDLVKFAKHRPGNDEINSAVKSCRTFVEETKPVAEPQLD